jgi:hypothetical protein
MKQKQGREGGTEENRRAVSAAPALTARRALVLKLRRGLAEALPQSSTASQMEPV